MKFASNQSKIKKKRVEIEEAYGLWPMAYSLEGQIKPLPFDKEIVRIIFLLKREKERNRGN